MSRRRGCSSRPSRCSTSWRRPRNGARTSASCEPSRGIACRGGSEDVRHGIRAALVPTVVAGAVLGGAMFVLAVPLGRWLTSGVHAGDLTAALRVMAPFLPLSAAYAVVLAVTRGFGTMVPSVIIDKLGRAAAQPIFVLAVVVTGLSTRGALPGAGPCRSRSGWRPPSSGWEACSATSANADPELRSEQRVAAERSSSSSGCSPLPEGSRACSRSSSCGSTHC